MTRNDAEELFTVGDVNREARGKLSPAMVRHLADTGVLPAMRTVRGQRLFKRADVQKVIADRKSKD